MNRGSALTTVFLIAVCGALFLPSCASSGKAATKRAKPGATTGSSPSRVTTTTRPPTPTTRQLNGAQFDQVAMFALTTAVNAAHTIYQQSYDYTAVSPASLSPLVPKLQLGDVARASKTVVGVLAQDRNDVLLVTRSGSGRWYCVIDNAMDGISYGEGPTRDAVDSNGECQQAAWPAPGKAQSLF